MTITLKGIDFSYCGGLDIDYEVDNPGCSGCEPDGGEYDYCRCGEIVNVSVDTGSIRSWEIAKHITNALGIDDDVYLYALERHIKRDSPTFEVEVESGYYGQEMGAATLDAMSGEALTSLLGLSPLQAIQQILADEYDGKLLPVLRNAAPVVRRIPLKSIVLPNAQNAARAAQSFKYDNDQIKELEQTVPIAVCTEDQGIFRVIDGYYRITAIKRTKKRLVGVVVLEAAVAKTTNPLSRQGRRLLL